MKRSEMIKIISQVKLNEETGFELSLEEAVRILTEIESYGMQPPENSDYRYSWDDWEPEVILKVECPHCKRLTIPEAKLNHLICSECRGVIADRGSKLWQKYKGVI
jgi:ribosomal protein L37AE/L43A